MISASTIINSWMLLLIFRLMIGLGAFVIATNDLVYAYEVKELLLVLVVDDLVYFKLVDGDSTFSYVSDL